MFNNILTVCTIKCTLYSMKNITLSAQEDTIEKARKIAAEKHSTLNAMFREWLENISSEQASEASVEAKLNELWKRTSYLRVGKKLSRDEMNER